MMSRPLLLSALAFSTVAVVLAVVFDGSTANVAILTATLVVVIWYAAATLDLLLVSRKELDLARQREQRQRRRQRQLDSERLAQAKGHLKSLLESGVAPLRKDKYSDRVPGGNEENPVWTGKNLGALRNLALLMDRQPALAILEAQRALSALRSRWRKYTGEGHVESEEALATQLQEAAAECSSIISGALKDIEKEQGRIRRRFSESLERA